MLGDLTRFQQHLLRWYTRNARKLPWRTSPRASTRPDPYHVLVSEAMLQQTQVATVVPFFTRFIQRLPSISDLAEARPQELLRLWQGLGYYARVRNLQATAKIVVKMYDGRVPSSVQELRELPGIGPYTAGAIASIAYDQREAIVDGNVARVLCRLDAIQSNPKTPSVRKLLWQRAYEILPQRRIGHFNSALMDLGATVCTPRAPKCPDCPVRTHCSALARSIVDRTPLAAPARARPVERRCTFCITQAGKYLLEQRLAQGRWASMWQFPTVVSDACRPTSASLARYFGLNVDDIRRLGKIRHELTHRRYEFEVFRCSTRRPGKVRPRRWVRLSDLHQFPLPRPHVQIADLLRAGQ